MISSSPYTGEKGTALHNWYDSLSLGVKTAITAARPANSRASTDKSRKSNISLANMQKRDSILTGFYQRSRKDNGSDHREISPQTSHSSTRSNSSARSQNSGQSSNHSAQLSQESLETRPRAATPKPAMQRKASAASLPHVNSTSSTTSKATASLVKEPDSVGFNIRLETPPAIMYGTPQESLGALISGICDVDLTMCGSQTGGVGLIDVSMSIVQIIKFLVPPQVAKRLPKSTRQENVLATWDILKHPHFLESRSFAYPFSHLLPGTLPPTCNTPLFTIEYFVYASATTESNRKSEAKLPLRIGRSVVGVTEKTSVRIFPPTSLSLSMVLPTALFPQSKVKAEMRIEGLITDNQQTTSLKFKRWQLKRLNWRVDEIVKVRYGEGSDDEYEHKHTLGYGVHKTGWKTDFSIQNGLVELFSPDFCPQVLGKANKDLHDPVAGLSVSHQLICELLIAEEVVPSPTAKQGILSGSARVLRMQFGFPVVDRPGLGISWENEVPPMYADIPLSPPQYHEVADLPALEEFRSTNLVFSPLLSPQMSPTLRHFDPTLRGFERNPGEPSPLITSTMALAPSPGLVPLNSGNLSPTLIPSTPSSRLPSTCIPNKTKPLRQRQHPDASSSHAP